MKNKVLSSLLFMVCSFCVVPAFASVQKELIRHGVWAIYLNLEDEAGHDYWFRATQNGHNLFFRSHPQVNYDNENGEERSVNSASFATYTVEDAALSDDLGTGRCLTFTFSQPDNGDNITMTQRFYLYDGCDYLVTDLSISGSEKIRSNYLAPVSNKNGLFFFGTNEGKDNFRLLKVPFDNDFFDGYKKFPVDCQTTSYEAGAVINGNNGHGLVMGSVDHDHWKSAVMMDATSKNGAVKVCVYSGAADIKDDPKQSETRDVIPHGKLVGPTITSARMLIGYYEDWRDGMEDFADLCTKIATRTYDWEYGTPVGWQSWGVLAEKNSYEANVEIRDYYNDVLKPAGFVNDKGYQIISLDASDNHSGNQHKTFSADCAKNNQFVGCYGTPFSLWWGKNDFPREGTVNYGGKEYPQNSLVLFANGKPMWLDNAWCRDPTHPITKSDINNFIESAAADGIKYMKLDFVNCGIVQADSYHDPNVHTAVEAYCQGMKYLMAKAKKKGIFIALSIAPLFPHQFAHSRRISCDSWGTIGWSSFSMNAISGGWWTDRLYQFNDPDGLVMMGSSENGQFGLTEGENRARITNGICSGMVLMADNFSPSDQSGRGSNEISRRRAQKFLMNREINKMLSIGKSFRPVYGHKEWDGTSWISSENYFQYETGDYYYVAVFNFTNGGDMYNPTNKTPLQGTLPWTDLGFGTADFTEVRELWTDKVIATTSEGLPYNVPSADARMFRFTKSNPTGIVDAMQTENAGKLTLVSLPDEVMVYAGRNMSSVSVYDVQGKLLNGMELDDRLQVSVPVTAAKGVAIVKVRYADGTEETGKVNLK